MLIQRTSKTFWNCAQVYTVAAQNNWDAKATFTKNGDASFAIGELINLNVPKIIGKAPSFQATVSSLNDPAAGNKFAN